MTTERNRLSGELVRLAVCCGLSTPEQWPVCCWVALHACRHLSNGWCVAGKPFTNDDS